MVLKTLQDQTPPTASQNKSWPLRHALSSWLPITLVLLLAAAVFSYRLGAEGLWLDELTSIQDADQTPVEVFTQNQLRPLYYLVLMVWMKLVGTSSDVGLRVPSVFFALISVFLIYRLGRRLVDRPTGLIAALMLTCSPIFVNHAQEIRMYILSLCLGLAGTLCLVEALLPDSPRELQRGARNEQSHHPSQKILAGWSLFRLLAIYTVPLNITLLFADVLLILWRFHRDRAVLMSFAKWLLLLVVLWIPALLSVIQEAAPDSTYASHHPNASPPGMAELFRPLKFLTVWPFAVQDNAIASKFYKLFTLSLCGLISAALLLKNKSSRLSSSALSTSPSLWWVGAWWILPLVPIAAFSYLSIPIWVERYLLFITPYLLLLLAAGLTRLWQHWKPIAIAMAIIYLIAVGGGLVRLYTVQDRPDYKFNVETLEQYDQPGDGLVWSYHYQKGFNHYYDGELELSWAPLRDVKTPEDIQQWLSYFPTGYDRLWLVLDHVWSRIDGLEDAIASNYTIEKSFDYELGSKVMLLTPLNTSSSIPLTTPLTTTP